MRKELGAAPANAADTTTKTYTDTLVASALTTAQNYINASVAPLYAHGSNLVLDGSFENNAVWQNAWGSMVTSPTPKFGKQCRQLVSTNGGQTVDRIVLTHDAGGNPASVDLVPYAVVMVEGYIRKPASGNTGTGRVYINLHYTDGSGVEQSAGYVSWPEANILSTDWVYGNMFVNTVPANATSYYLTVELGGCPAGNTYYIDGFDMVDIGVLSGFQGTNLDISNCAVIPRILNITSTATPSINTDAVDQVNFTAQAAAITSMSSGLTGTPDDGQRLMFRFKSNGTSRAITWGSSFVSSGTNTLLATISATKTHMCEVIYDAVAAKWVCKYVDATGY